MRLRVTNFQSITDKILEFPIGITTIVGASNSGKTAIIRAVMALISNTSEAKDFIKYGTDKSEVTLEMDGLPKVKWTRSLKESTYTIDDEFHQKVGKTDLFDLQSDNGFCLDDVSGNIMNIQDEWSSLFPFDKNGSQLYKLFENIFSINDSTEVMSRIKNDESDLKKEIVEIDKIILKNSTKVEKISELMDNQPSESLKAMKNDLLDMIGNFNELDSDCSNVKDNMIYLSKCKNIENIDLDDSMITDYLELVKDAENISRYCKVLDTDIKDITFESDNISDFVDLSNDANAVKDLIVKLKTYNEELKKDTETLDKLKETLSSIKVCPLCNQEIGDSCCGD